MRGGFVCMLKMVTAILNHTARIMFFSHDGKGLPGKRSDVFWFLLFLATLFSLLSAYVSGEDMALSVVSTFFSILVASSIFSVRFAAAAAIVSIFIDLFSSASIFLFGADLRAPILFWAIISLFVLSKKLKP